MPCMTCGQDERDHCDGCFTEREGLLNELADGLDELLLIFGQAGPLLTQGGDRTRITTPEGWYDVALAKVSTLHAGLAGQAKTLAASRAAFLEQYDRANDPEHPDFGTEGYHA